MKRLSQDRQAGPVSLGRPVVIAGVARAGFAGAMRLIAADLRLPIDAYGIFASPESPSEAETQPIFGLLAG